MADNMDVSFEEENIPLWRQCNLAGAKYRQENGLTPCPDDDELLLFDGMEQLLEPEQATAPVVGLLGTSSSGGQVGATASHQPASATHQWTEQDMDDLLANLGTEPMGGNSRDPAQNVSKDQDKPQGQQQQTLACTACPRVFAARRRLKAHWDTQHGDFLLGYPCPLEGFSWRFHFLHKGLMRSDHCTGYQRASEDVKGLMLGMRV